MKIIKITLCSLLLAMGISTSFATDNNENKVLAKVNGVEITQIMLDQFVESFLHSKGQPTMQLNDEQKKAVLDNLITYEVIAQNAVKKGVDKTQKAKAVFANSNRQILTGMFIEEYKKNNAVTDEELKKDYEKATAIKAFEYNADHILLKTEEEAKKVIDELNKGADFSTVAKEKSQGPSGKTGGKLGWFKSEQMVKPFSDATAKLEKGKITQAPVQTKFGFHVIKLNDKREAAPVAFEQWKQEVVQQKEQQKIQALIESLKQKAKIEMVE